MQVLLDLTEQRDLQALERRLELQASTDRAGLTGTVVWAPSLQMCSCMPSMATQLHTATQEELALQAFLQGLTLEQLCQQVYLTMPQSLREALREA